MDKINYGFVEPKYDEKDYRVFGVSLPKIVLQDDGNWEPYLPKYERQYFTLGDSYGCTAFGTLNAIETMLKKLYGGEYDFSERYPYNIVGIEPPGADPKEVAQAIRKNGNVDEKDLPYVDDLKEFRTPRPMSDKYLNKGRDFLKKFIFQYEWIFEGGSKNKTKLLREYLRYSPIGISVSAWTQNDQGEYYSNGQNNHWCLLYKIDEKGRFYVFDSYDQSKKILTADHDIRFAMRYNISNIEEAQKDILKSLIKILNGFISYLKKSGQFAGEIITATLSKRQD